ncbi:hypothetical protein IID22_05270 [Patescibacteria group bacterium]|nr:hypothetical protein [Patescibacteria group bacterium]
MQSRKVTLTVPFPKVDLEKIARDVAKTVVDATDSLIEYLYSVVSAGLRNISRRFRKRSGGDVQIRPLNKFGETRKKRLNPQVLKISKVLLLIGATVVVIVGLSRLVGRIGGTSSSNKACVASAKAVQGINREFSFPLRNGNNEEVSQIKYLVEKAELRDEIIVKGQRATAVKGRVFLILTLKITNDYDQAIEIDTRDYMRLTVNNNELELLAPDIHNDPVEIQAISTKFTRLGFPINDSDKEIVLRGGEITGDKEKIVLELN